MARGIASFGPEAAWYICKLRIAQSIRRQFGRPRPVLPRRDPRGLLTGRCGCPRGARHAAPGAC
jgi:hypothetical protein